MIVLFILGNRTCDVSTLSRWFFSLMYTNLYFSLLLWFHFWYNYKGWMKKPTGFLWKKYTSESLHLSIVNCLNFSQKSCSYVHEGLQVLKAICWNTSFSIISNILLIDIGLNSSISRYDSFSEGTKHGARETNIELDELYRMDSISMFGCPNPGFYRKIHHDSPIEETKSWNLYS